ncbi:MAG TPA: hypothetical protein VFO27_04805 [Bryobacteraceae bacterium]|nr:hypothetical protein [Bryobacteraceae bacterium]
MMKKFSTTVLLALCAPLAAQVNLTFAVQDRSVIPGLKESASVWGVTACSATPRTVLGGTVIRIAVGHGLSPQMLELAVSQIQQAAGRTWPAITLKVLTVASASTAVAALLKTQGNLAASPTTAKVMTWSAVAAGVAAIAMPYVASQTPPGPPPAEAHILTPAGMILAAGGCESTLFFARRLNPENPFEVSLP